MKAFLAATILIAISFLAWQQILDTFSKGPNEKTIKLANTIERYPQAKTWVVEPSRNLCFFAKDKCDQPVSIKFTSDANWNVVFDYFKNYFLENKWQTNTARVLSAPDSATYTSAQCKTIVEKNTHGFLGVGKQDKGKFKLSITCAQD